MITFLSKIASFFPFCLLWPDSSQEYSAQGITFLEMLEKDSWVLEDDSKYAGKGLPRKKKKEKRKKMCRGGIKLKDIFLRKHLSHLPDQEFKDVYNKLSKIK